MEERSCGAAWRAVERGGRGRDGPLPLCMAQVRAVRWRTWPWLKTNVGVGPSSLAYRLGVPMADAATGGRSVGKSVKGARIHRFFLNKKVHDCPLPGAPTIGVLSTNG
jgi:hypothetical protein